MKLRSVTNFFALLFVFSISLAVPRVAHAQTKTWTGSIDSNWNNTGNWSPSGVPGATDFVYIHAQSGNPFPTISQQNVTIDGLQIADYRAGELTVSNGKSLTINDGLNIEQGGSGGQLIINSGGSVHLAGGSFTMAYNNAHIQVNTGSFTSDVYVNIRGDGLSAGENVDLDFNNGLDIDQDKPFTIQSGNLNIDGDFNTKGPTETGSADITVSGDIIIKSGTDNFTMSSGSLDVGGTLTVNTAQKFNVNAATVNVQGTSQIDGIYYGDDGSSTFNGELTVGDGGRLHLDTGTINFNGGAFIGTNGKAYLGSGTTNFQGDIRVESSGEIEVQDADMNVSGDGNFSNTGNLSVQNGSISFTGNVDATSNGNITLNNGSFNVGGNIDFSNTGRIHAGSSQIDIKGDFTFDDQGSVFEADSSTVTFSGDGTQKINTGGENVTFHNVVVKSGSSVQTDGSDENTVIIDNDLTVEEGAQVGVKDNDTIDIQNNLDNQGTVESPRPFVYGIETPSKTTVVIIFDQPMGTSAGNAGNYSINNGISVTGATFDSSDPTKAVLTVSPALTEGVEYGLTITQQNVKSKQGETLSNSHLKRFGLGSPGIYYSIKNGNWNDPGSWSLTSHTGAAASTIPNNRAGNTANIGNGNTISVSSAQDISGMNKLLVESSGTFDVANGGTLTLNDFVVTGDGTFTLDAGGTLQIGSPNGITSAGTSAGNIQTAQRNFGAGSYIFAGSSAQQTGSGLPQTINDLTIDNTSNITATNNIQADGTLHLKNGSLIIPSGQGVIAHSNDVQNGDLIFRRILSGSPGWRMLSSPINTDYDNFLSGILTQGYDGAYYDASVAPNDTLQPNVLFYDETYEGTDNQRWRKPSSASSSVRAGRGFNTYLFGDVSVDDRYNDVLPDTLVVEGQENELTGGQFDFNVTYTAKADTGWNLVGNPFGASLDWDDSGWTKTNMDNVVYVWDPDSKSYKTWNGSTGSLTDGIIPPFQSFWVKANSSNPSLNVSESAKTFGGDFVGKIKNDPTPKIEIAMKQGDVSSSLFFSFSRQAKVGKDVSDAYYLEPPPGVRNYASLYSIDDRGNKYVIDALPRDFGAPIKIPIGVKRIKNGYETDGNVTLDIKSFKNIPSGWNISLIDRKNNKTITPSSGMQYSFALQHVPQKRKAKPDSVNVLKKKYLILGNADPSEARFMLQISPGSDADSLPAEVKLQQNYPNPFNDQTTIQFKLPIQDKVTLEVFDILGRRIATLINDKSYQAGTYTEIWNPSARASGVYIYRFVTKNKTITKKMTYIK